MASTAIKRKSPRQRASRRRSRYAEPETDDDLQSTDFDSEAELPRELAPPAPKRQRRARVQHKPKTRSRSAVQGTRSMGKRKRKGKTLELGTPRRARWSSTRQKKIEIRIPSDGVIPSWKALPADILKDIFIFAGQPISNSNATWLVQAAKTCKAFMEPALEALYYWPAVWRPISLYQMLATLEQREGRLMNYNTKVKRLDIDVQRLAYTAPNRALFDLSELLIQLPRLQHLEIVHPEDEPPYRAIPLASWSYPLNMFGKLVSAQVRLTSWRWTYGMLKNRSHPYKFISDMHGTTAFEGLQELILCGFHPPKLTHLPTPTVDGESNEPDLLSAISMLANLKDISFVSCDVVEKDWLSGLPPYLERLELSNCQYIYTEGFSSYLSSSGSQLKELVLNHNPAIDLSFLPRLKQDCPRLEVLEMDLHFYSSYFNTSQMDPEYDELLTADEIPTWPSTMRQIDLVHMQKWKSQGADNLFQSLVSNAPDLPALRYIVLHSHIDIPWRDRAKFRDDWIMKLQQVFKRPSRAPFAQNGSKLQYKLWKQRHTPVNQQRPVLYQVESQGSASTLETSDTPLAESSARRSRRVADASQALQLKMLSIEPQRSVRESNSDSEQEAPAPVSNGDVFVQGLCDVVDIRIDNQRPRENQFTEHDFLDAEASGDDDWHQNDREVADGYAW